MPAGRPFKREFAKAAADAIRKGHYHSVPAAALAFIGQHHGWMKGLSAKRIRQTTQFRHFKDAIYEEFERGPNPMRLHYRVLSQRSAYRRRQPKQLPHELRTAAEGLSSFEKIIWHLHGDNEEALHLVLAERNLRQAVQNNPSLSSQLAELDLVRLPRMNPSLWGNPLEMVRTELLAPDLLRL